MERHILGSKFKTIAAAFQSKTGLPLLAVNLEGKIIHQMGKCGFCQKIVPGQKKKLIKNCQAALAKAIEESFRWGEGYITTCPVGLILFAVPLIAEKRLKGGLVSGFAIFPEMKKDIEEEVYENLKKYLPRRLHVQSAGLTPRLFSLKKAKEYVAFLLQLTGRFGVNDLNFLKIRNEKYLQQQKIAAFLEVLKKENRDISRQILDKQEEIIQKVKLGDTSGAREILNEFLGSIFFESGMNFDVLKVRMIELVVIISRAAIEAGVEAKELLGLNYSYLTELNKATDLDELLHKLTTVLENFINKVSRVKERKRSIRVAKMKDFIHQNFTRKVTAREVAREAALSVSRALHLFKEETGTPLTYYINKLKVDYGKYLLLNTAISLASLANELGFFDQSHFTKNFKKFEKMTPSHYRLKYKPEI